MYEAKNQEKRNFLVQFLFRKPLHLKNKKVGFIIIDSEKKYGAEPNDYQIYLVILQLGNTKILKVMQIDSKRIFLNKAAGQTKLRTLKSPLYFRK